MQRLISQLATGLYVPRISALGFWLHFGGPCIVRDFHFIIPRARNIQAIVAHSNNLGELQRKSFAGL